MGQALLETCFNHANIVTNLIRYEEQYPAFGDSREAKLIKVIFFANQREDSAAKSNPSNNLLFVIILTGEELADC